MRNSRFFDIAIGRIALMFAIVISGCSRSFLQNPISTEMREPGTAITKIATLTLSSIGVSTISTMDTKTISTPSPTTVYLPLINNVFPGKNIFGAALNTITDQDGLGLMVSARSGWTRRDYPWNIVEPESGKIDLDGPVASLNQELINASQSKMEVILVLGNTPSWAAASHASCEGRVDPTKLPDLAEFTQAWVKKYSQAPYNVHYFELWNEPDVDGSLGCWGNLADTNYYGGEDYGQMLQAVYPAMKKADPTAQVLVGGLLLDCNPNLTLKLSDGSDKSCLPAKFLNGILESGAGNAFDGISFHAYDYYGGQLGHYSNANFAASWDTTGPVETQKAEYLRSVLSAHQLTNKFLMNTEAGIYCNSNCTTPEYNSTSAYYLAENFTAALAEGFRANVWYAVYGGRNRGLIENNNGTLNTLSTYNAFKFTTNMFFNMEFKTQPNIASGVKVYEFSDGRSSMWVVWSTDDNDHLVTLEKQPSRIFTYTEAIETWTEATTSQQIMVAHAPIFIKFAQ
jgi:hypothetical protein